MQRLAGAGAAQRPAAGRALAPSVLLSATRFFCPALLPAAAALLAAAQAADADCPSGPAASEAAAAAATVSDLASSVEGQAAARLAHLLARYARWRDGGDGASESPLPWWLPPSLFTDGDFAGFVSGVAAIVVGGAEAVEGCEREVWAAVDGDGGPASGEADQGEDDGRPTPVTLAPKKLRSPTPAAPAPPPAPINTVPREPSVAASAVGAEAEPLRAALAQALRSKREVLRRRASLATSDGAGSPPLPPLTEPAQQSAPAGGGSLEWALERALQRQRRALT